MKAAYHTQKQPLGHLAPLVPILALAIFVSATDFYVVALPSLPAALSTSREAVQLTVSFYLAAYALSTLFWGPLSDRFGRKPILASGLLCFALASIAAAAAPSIEALLAARMAQGAAASSGTVLVAVMIKEMCEGPRVQRWMGIMAMAIVVGPALAPLIGAFLIEGFGWRAPFGLLALLALLMLVLLKRGVEETIATRLPQISLAKAAKTYSGVLRNRSFMRFQLINGFGVAGFFAFATGAPFVFMTGFGSSTYVYALIQGGTILTYVFGTATSSLLAKRHEPLGLVKRGLRISYLGLSGLLLFALLSAENATALCLGIYVTVFGMGLIMPNAWVLMLDPVGSHEVASASALSGVFQMALGSLASLAITALPQASPGAMAWTFVACGLGVAAAFHLLAPTATKPLAVPKPSNPERPRS